MRPLDAIFNSDYLDFLLSLLPVSFVLGCFLSFVCWALGLAFCYFARIVRA